MLYKGPKREGGNNRETKNSMLFIDPAMMLALKSKIERRRETITKGEKDNPLVSLMNAAKVKVE